MSTSRPHIGSVISPMELAAPSPSSSSSPENSRRRPSSLDLHPLDLNELEPLPPSQAEQGSSADAPQFPIASTPPSTSTKSQSSSRRKQQQRQQRQGSSSASNASSSMDPARDAVLVTSPKSIASVPSRSSFESTGESGWQPATAHYVTVSSILSRSGAAIAAAEFDSRGSLRSTSNAASLSAHRRRGSSSSSSSSSSSATGAVAPEREEGERPRPRLMPRHKSSVDVRGGKRPASNGSALEALGALLLQRDSSGKVASLSFTRHDGKRSRLSSFIDVGKRGGGGGGSSSAGSSSRPLMTASQALSSVSRAWLQGVKEAGASRLGIKMPSTRDGRGQTIAQRRARRQGAMAFEASMNDDGESGFRLVGTRAGHPTFEVGVERGDSVPPDHLEPPDDLSLGHLAPAEDEMVSLAAGGPQKISARKRTILDEPLTGPRSKNIFGPGSAFALEDPPDAPPSPVAMPGAWWGGSGSFWGSRSGEGHEEGALLLPPPLLDDQGSDAKSFEGLLGVRRMREQERARKQLEKLKARNRPAHKVGMLTAFGNFIKAAHAADKASKAAAKAGQSRGRDAPSLFEDRPGGMQRRHTEPMDFNPTLTVPDSDDDSEEEGEEERGEEAEDGIASAQADTPRLLDTVYEGSGSEQQQQQQQQQQSSLTRRERSRPPSRRSSLIYQVHHSDYPRAPRLVPIHTPGTNTPFTPMSLDGHSRSLDSDYISSRILSIHEPATPRIGPTLLSLPPSPWTPYLDNGQQSQTHQTTFLVMTPVQGPPGTPRLAPTYVEMNPSPFPTPSLYNRSPRIASHLGPLTTLDDDDGKKTAGVTSSPPNHFSPLALSPTASPTLSASQKLRKRKTHGRGVGQNNDSGTLTPSRLTPAQMIRTPSKERERQSLMHQHVTADMDAETPNLSNGDSHPHPRFTEEVVKKDEVQKQEATGEPAQRPPQRRSFLLWFLLGDLGLGTRSKIAAKASGSPEPQSAKNQPILVRFTISLAAHTYGFLIFVLAHLVDLVYRIAENLSLIFWFLHWTFMNLTGQTVLSRCAIEAYRLVQNEWATVSMEDHEEKGTKIERRKSTDVGYRRPSLGGTGSTSVSVGSNSARRKSLGDNVTPGDDEDKHEDVSEVRPKGLSRWQVLRGLFELYCLQDVTRQRYVAEGAGLEKIEGWSTKRTPSRSTPLNEQTPVASDSAKPDRVDLGAKRSADRRAREESANSLLQRRDDATEEGSNDESDDEDSDESDDEEESSDDEMVVTRQGPDVLEFTKTPRIEQRDRSTGSGSGGGYFGSLSSNKKESRTKQGAAKKTQVTNSEARQMIKTIKWASRLAISAYGLHVTLVDLPETFTPSGNRFSRQTFAHLSRLHHEDVLHADIQTLDSDAYSPTFYLVRDYSRKVVVVSVRGTQSLQDIIVDLEMIVTDMDLPPIEGIDGESSSSSPLRCHAGILRAAKALIGRDSTLFTTLSRALEENEGFGIVFTGHSLGGAIASTVVLLLSQYRKTGQGLNDGEWVTHHESGLPADRPIRAITFAHPATVSAALAQRSSLGKTPLVLSVVLGSDIIPRCGHGQARELRRVLGALSRVRRRHEKAFLKIQQRARSYRASKSQKGEAVDEEEKDARVHIATSWWRWRKLSQKLASGQGLSGEEAERKKRIETDLWKLRCDVEADLYAAVEARQRAAATAARGPRSPWLSGEGDSAPLHQLTTRRQALDASTMHSEAVQGGILVPAGRNYWLDSSPVEAHAAAPSSSSSSSSSSFSSNFVSDGKGYEKGRAKEDEVSAELYEVKSPLGFFSLPDLQTKMFAHHFPSAYETALLEDLRL